MVQEARWRLLRSALSNGPRAWRRDAMKLSVLICTYNRPDLLAQSLDALICRTTENPDQVVVVNGGDERTDEVVLSIEERAKSKGLRIEIKLVKTVNKNLAASR